MKVICIDASPGKGYNKKTNLIEGNVYTVLEVFTDCIDNCTGYLLKEIRSINCIDGIYMADRFIPLSEQDENELVNQKEETLNH